MRVRIKYNAGPGGPTDVTGTATKAEDHGYIVEWDDGWQDSPQTRWYFEGTGFADLVAIE